jgi:hypothetical protein
MDGPLGSEILLNSLLFWVGARKAGFECKLPQYWKLVLTNLCLAIARKSAVCWQRIYFESNFLTQASKQLLHICESPLSAATVAFTQLSKNKFLLVPPSRMQLKVVK